jgi:hypothetical protein
MQPLIGYYQGEFYYTQPTKIFNRCNHRLDITRGNFITHNQPKYSIDATTDWILPGGIYYTQPTKIFKRCNHWLDTSRGNFNTHNRPKYLIDATIDRILPGRILLHTANQNIQ